MHRTIFCAPPVLSILAALAMALPMNGADKPSNDERARAFVTIHEKTLRPLEYAVNLAWWNANISGKDADFKAKEEAQNKLDAALSERSRFGEVKALKKTRLKEPVLHREIDVLY